MGRNSIRVSIITSYYKGFRYLEDFFTAVVAQTIFSLTEIVFINNDPTPEELSIVESFQNKYPDHIQHIVVKPMESIGKSWNRAWLTAKGEYLCIWNVDDRRPPDSLEQQFYLLDNSPLAVLTYGDYIIVPEYGLETGLYRITPRFQKRLFSRKFPQGGAFYMWRRRLGKQICYFDEQLKTGMDFDFSVRIAMNNLYMERTDQLAGFFTDANQGLSTRGERLLSATERTVIQLRYGIYDLVHPEYLDASSQYRVGHIFVNDQWYPMEKLVPNYQYYIKRRKFLWILGYLRNVLRCLLDHLGVLEVIHALLLRSKYREV